MVFHGNGVMVFYDGNTMETMLFHGSYPRSPYKFSMVQHGGHGIPWDLLQVSI